MYQALDIPDTSLAPKKSLQQRRSLKVVVSLLSFVFLIGYIVFTGLASTNEVNKAYESAPLFWMPPWRFKHMEASRLSATSDNTGSFSELETWLKSKKGIVKVNKESVLTTEVGEGNVIFEVPVSLCLTSEKATALFKSIGVTADKLRTRNIGLLALLILVEKYKGSASEYAAFIFSLPEQVPNILSWNDEQVGLLEKSTTRDIRAQLSAIDQDFAALLTLNTPLLPKDQFTEAEFKWAIGIVKDQMVILEDGMPYVVPGLDVITIDSLSEIEATLQSTGIGLFGGKVVRVNADKIYSTGERFSMSRGFKTSAQCLEDHGLVPTLAEEDCSCEVTIAIEDGDKFKDDKINVLEDEGYGPKMRFDLEASIDMEIDPLLIQFLRLKLIQGQDSFILEAVFNSIVWETMSLPFSKNNELMVLQYLTDLCKDKLNILKSIDNESNVDANSNDPRDLITRLRGQEIAALEGTLERVQVEIQQIEAPVEIIEYYQERRLRELDLLRPLEDDEIVT